MRQQVLESRQRAASGGAHAGEPRLELGVRRRVGGELAARGRTLVADALADRPGILAGEHVLADDRVRQARLGRDRARQIRQAGDDGADRLVPAFGILEVALRLRLRGQHEHPLVERFDRCPALRDLGALFHDSRRQAGIDAGQGGGQAGIGLAADLLELALGIVDRLQRGLGVAAAEPRRSARLEEDAVRLGQLGGPVGQAKLRPRAADLDEQRDDQRHGERDEYQVQQGPGGERRGGPMSGGHEGSKSWRNRERPDVYASVSPRRLSSS